MYRRSCILFPGSIFLSIRFTYTSTQNNVLWEEKKIKINKFIRVWMKEKIKQQKNTIFWYGKKIISYMKLL